MTFVIICLDGFRYDYIKETSFLKKIMKKSRYGEIYHGFGYASQYSAITGKSVEDLGIIANFYYKPKKLDFYSFFSFVDNFPFKKNLRIFLDLIYNAKEFLRGNNQPKSIFQIPLKYSRFFNNSVKKNIFEEKFKSPSFFEIFRDKKISGYMWPFIFENNKAKIDILNLSLNTSNTDKRAFEKSIKLLEKKPDICYIHLFSADNLIHKFGTKSDKTKEIIDTLDDYSEKLNKYADKLLIFSDHGMTEVNEILNLRNLINKTNLKYGKDYVMFLDSTLARFWFFNEQAKIKIKNLLLKIKKGRIISLKNKELHKKFGELIFQVNSGVLILPNFYQKKPDKAMHGYDDKLKTERGFYLFLDKKNTKKQKKDIKMKEIFDIIQTNILSAFS